MRSCDRYWIFWLLFASSGSLRQFGNLIITKIADHITEPQLLRSSQWVRQVTQNNKKVLGFSKHIIQLFYISTNLQPAEIFTKAYALLQQFKQIQNQNLEIKMTLFGNHTDRLGMTVLACRLWLSASLFVLHSLYTLHMEIPWWKSFSFSLFNKFILSFVCKAFDCFAFAIRQQLSSCLKSDKLGYTSFTILKLYVALVKMPSYFKAESFQNFLGEPFDTIME